MLRAAANPRLQPTVATHNGGSIQENKKWNKEPAQAAKSQAAPNSSFCCLRCIFEMGMKGVD